MPDPEAIFSTSSLFAALDPAARERVLALGTRRRYAKGEVLFVELQEGDELMLVLDGSVSVQLALRNADDPCDVAVLGTGEILGEVSLVEEGTRSATAIAETDVEVLVWQCATLREEFEKDPRLGYVLTREVAKILARRLRQMNLRLLDSVLWGTL